MREASVVLGNTPTVARKSYVDPRVIAKFTAGHTVDASKPASVESELQRLLS